MVINEIYNDEIQHQAIRTFYNEETKEKEAPAILSPCYGKIYLKNPLIPDCYSNVIFIPSLLKDILENKNDFKSCKKLLSEWATTGDIRISKDGKHTVNSRIENRQQKVIYFNRLLDVDSD